jgi:hypothetical protein
MLNKRERNMELELIEKVKNDEISNIYYGLSLRLNEKKV